MKRSILAVLLLCVSSLPALASSDVEVRKINGEFGVGRARAVSIDFPVGDLTIEGGAGDHVVAQLSAHCESGDREECEDHARRIRLVTSVDGETFVLKVDGMDKVHLNAHGFSVRGKILVPRDRALRVEMGAGDLEVAGVAADVDAELGVGDATLRLRHASSRSVRIGVGVGEATLHVRGERIEGSGFLGKKLKWYDGKGETRINLDVGVGDADVRLE